MQKLQDITFTGKTDMGLKRDHNEDNFVSAALSGSLILLCCIDGVGGMAGGDVCSAAVAGKMEQYLKDMLPDENPGDVLKRVMVRINNDIITMQKDMPEYSKMGCVVTAILVDVESNKTYMAHVGDTRLYEYADNQLVKLSHDHSPVGIREEMGILTEEEAMSHPKRNIIERCIGDEPLDDDTDYIETAVFPFKKGATYLLCSDGLTDLVTAAGISQILAGEEDVDEKTDKLIAAANDAGGKDNITVLLLENPDKRTEEEKLADLLVDNETVGKSEARLIPDNGMAESPSSSQLLDTVAEEDLDNGNGPVDEGTGQTVNGQEDKTENKEDKHITYKSNGSTRLLGLVVLVLAGIIIWMGWDIHVIKQNQMKMMADTVAIREIPDTVISQQPDDTLSIDSTKITLPGDSLQLIIPDSLRTDSLTSVN